MKFDLKSGIDPITFTFSENSNYWRKSLLEVIRQNVGGWCQQTLKTKSLLTSPTNILPLQLKQTFPLITWWVGIQAKSFLLYITCTELVQNCNSTSNFSSYFGLIDARMSASDKDSPVRLKTGFDPITYTPFSRKRKKTRKEKWHVFS